MHQAVVTPTVSEHKGRATASTSRALTAMVLFTASITACSRSAQSVPLAPGPADEISRIEAAPEIAGELIYEGRVYSQDTARSTPLFRYERRVRASGGMLVSTHVTRDTNGHVVVTQAAEHDSSYRVVSANLIQRQTGLSALVRVVGNRATYTRVQGGRTDHSTETLDLPLTSGPTLFGFIGTQWDVLIAGKRLPIRYAVLERNESIGFVLERVFSSSHDVTFRMTPSSRIIQLAVAPTYFHFDSATRQVRSYEGRMPPLERVGDELHTLDARVKYAFYVAQYR